LYSSIREVLRKTNGAGTSEKNYSLTWCHIPEERIRQPQRRGKRFIKFRLYSGHPIFSRS